MDGTLPDPPRDAHELVTAAAKLREVTGVGASVVGTLNEILNLLRLPVASVGTDRVNTTPCRLRQRCGWALDFGVADTLVEVMHAYPDCVEVQSAAVECLADVAEAFVEKTSEGFQANGNDDAISSSPFDVSGVITNAHTCAQILETSVSGSHSKENTTFLDTHLKHASVFRELDPATRRQALKASKVKKYKKGEEILWSCFDRDDSSENDSSDPSNVFTDRTVVLTGTVRVGLIGDTSTRTSQANNVKTNGNSFSQKCDAVVVAIDEFSNSLDSPLLVEAKRSYEDHNATLSTGDLANLPHRLLTGDEIGVQAMTSRLRQGHPDETNSMSEDFLIASSKYVQKNVSLAAGDDGCCLLIVPGCVLESAALGDAISEGLMRFSFFEDEDEDTGDADDTNKDDRNAQTVSEMLSAEDALFSPHEKLARRGAADAVLHVGLRCAGVCMSKQSSDNFRKQSEGEIGSEQNLRVQLALSCFRFIESVACDSTNRKLGADGAMDRIAATCEVFRDDEKIAPAAGSAMRALTNGNEQNMRLAFGLGQGGVVW